MEIKTISTYIFRDYRFWVGLLASVHFTVQVHPCWRLLVDWVPSQCCQIPASLDSYFKQNSRLLEDLSRLQNFHPRLHLQLHFLQHFLLSSKKIAIKSAFIIYIINTIMNLKGQCHEIFCLQFFLQRTSPGSNRHALNNFKFFFIFVKL